MRCPSPLLGFARPRNLRSHPLQPVPSSARRLDGAAPDYWEAGVSGPNRGPGDETNAAGSCCRVGSTLNSAPRNPGGGIRSNVIDGKSRTPAGGSTGKKRVALAYPLGVISTLPIFARLAEMTGRKLMYLFGFALFAFASASSGLASNLTQLIGLRVLQGL